MPTTQFSDDLLGLYCQTCYDVRLPGGGARLTLQIGKPVADELRTWAADDWPLIFISACNPHSDELSAMENRRRMRALRARLDQLQVRWLPGVGHIQRQSWREPSFLVAGLPIKAIDRIAFEFGQRAIVIAMQCTKLKLQIYCNERCDRLCDQPEDIDWVMVSGWPHKSSGVTWIPNARSSR